MIHYRGVRYPIEDTPKGLMSNASDIDQIKSNLLVIILTLPGERVFEPEFGTPLHLLRINDMMKEERTRMMIASSIRRWEKRIQVEDIKVEFVPDEFNQYIMRIDIDFISPTNIQQVEHFSLESIVGDYILCG